MLLMLLKRTYYQKKKTQKRSGRIARLIKEKTVKKRIKTIKKKQTSNKKEAKRFLFIALWDQCVIMYTTYKRTIN